MDKCPPEILSRIFELTCTDGGFTAGVLRLVSKQIAIHAEAYRFWSVCINGVDRLALFVPLITNLEHTGQYVQHLFISDQPGTYHEDGELRSRTTRWSDTDTQLFKWDLPRRPPQTDLEVPQLHPCLQEANKFAELLPPLLKAVHPKLETLTILAFNFGCTTWLTDIAIVSFPVLHRLSLYFKRKVELPVHGFQMPSLRSLDLHHSWGHMAYWWPWIHSFMRASDKLQALTFVWLGIDSFSRSQFRALHGKLPNNIAVPETCIRDSLSKYSSHKHFQYVETVTPLPRVMEMGSIRIQGVMPYEQFYLDDDDTARLEVEWLQSRVRELEDDGVIVALGPSNCPDYVAIRTEWENGLAVEAMRHIFA